MAKVRKSRLERIKEICQAWVDSGKKIEDMSIHDPEYKYIHDAKLLNEDGKRFTVEEKFALAGYPRASKSTKGVKERLIQKIADFKKEGRSFHMTRKKLPFYPELSSYRKTLGYTKSSEEVMHELGYREYSDLYFRLSGLEKISQYRDEQGYVDSYRSDEKFFNFVKSAAVYLDMPIPVVVELVCDEKLKVKIIQSDFIAYVSECVKNYLSQHENDKNGKSLVGVSENDPELYARLRYIKRFYFGDEKYVFDEELEFLGIDEDVDHKFKDGKVQEDIAPILEEIKQLAKEKGRPLTQKDIPSRLFIPCVKQAYMFEVPMSTYFSFYEIDYKGQEKASRLNKFKTDKLPNIDEMRKRRDELVAVSGVSKENGNCKEEIFEKWIESCMLAYQEYNFEDDKNYGKGIKENLKYND